MNVEEGHNVRPFIGSSGENPTSFPHPIAGASVNPYSPESSGLYKSIREKGLNMRRTVMRVTFIYNL